MTQQDTELRRFEDREQRGWEIHPVEDFKWQFVPLEGNDQTRRIVTPPPEVDDPFEVSEAQLQRLLDSGIPSEDATEPLRTDEG